MNVAATTPGRPVSRASADGPESSDGPDRPGWRFWVDRGGTFTDVIARDPAGQLHVRKLLSVNPQQYEDAAIAGIRESLGIAASASIPVGLIDEVRIGTTLATNALLEREGERTLLLVNRGCADLLRIGNQARPRLFDLNVIKPAMLYERVAEVPGRFDVGGSEIEALDEHAANTALREARAAGIQACAIVLMHSWKYPAHERRLAALARAAGFTQISLSHEVSQTLRIIPRGNTTVVDSYLSPLLHQYVSKISAELQGVRLYFMQSNGGLAAASAFHGKDAVLSGPAGGVVGAAYTAEMGGFSNIIGFDMGGTSTDVALYAGAFERTFDATLAGVAMRVPMMAINTVAAGGGSILEFDGARFRVGPGSAGANPGPACYRQGGPLTVTDANVCVGKIQPEHFPAIFGEHGNQPLDRAVVMRKFQELADRVAQSTGQKGETRDPRDIAEGFLRIAVMNMANAIKQVSVQRGHDPQHFVLQSFGGAGAQHACMVADELGMDTVLIHPLASVLSAYGIGLAQQVVFREQAVEQPFVPEILPNLEASATELGERARDALVEQGALRSAVGIQVSLHLRYAGTDTDIVVPLGAYHQVVAAVDAEHQRRFGFAAEGQALVTAAVSIEATVAGQQVENLQLSSEGRHHRSLDEVEIWQAGSALRVPVYDRATLSLEHDLPGPVLIREATTMTMVEAGWTARLSENGNLVMRRSLPRTRERNANLDRADPVLLEIFNNLFMNVAEQAGAVLQNTARSVNIKERLDFSCAIFDGAGNLVANAPHVPVHLGAMGESVRAVLSARRDTLRPGDVVTLNDPVHGGTHLPDITVITPVFDEAGKEIRFFVGSRGHHADVGGVTPGSMPHDSTCLEEEGVVIDNFLLVQAGHMRENEFRALLAGATYPARNIDMNVADIKAQIAGNQRGVRELQRLIERHGWPMVAAYMLHVRANAADAVRAALRHLKNGSFEYKLDNGAMLKVRITLDAAQANATIDFTGTGPQQSDNFNAPRAVSRAAVLYVFRCLVADDIPLNEGCLEPLKIIIPPGSFLDPDADAAVVAGNTELSQAVCNALFGALGALAGSQGTMNNFLFGDGTRQYYETICGGMGAGPGFHGASAIQAHMTNTRMTDPEVLELRYPVRLEAFAVRQGSGGRGEWHGGEGALRRLRFLEPMTAVIVSSNRSTAPFGVDGGAEGKPGRQWVERADGSRLNLPARATVALLPGDVFVIETPGGGGYGTAVDLPEVRPTAPLQAEVMSG